MIEASPTNPDTTTTASQVANSGSSSSELDAGERADQRGHALAAAKAVPHRKHVAEDGGERADRGQPRRLIAGAAGATPGSASAGSTAAATQPLATSMMMTQIANAAPCVRSALVAPALPLPDLRMSTPPRRLPTTRLPTIEPRR